MCIVTDFNNLYTNLAQAHNLKYVLHCGVSGDNNLVSLSSLKTYFCCAINANIKKCVLHNCVVIILGTWLDKKFRANEDDYGYTGTFVIDGRHFSFPNIMMNNNVLIHNFFDKQYARNKKMKRMFLYGNYDEDKFVNRAIQLVYDKIDNVLYVRDVYAKDYIVNESINEILKKYLSKSGKWPEMDFVFDFEDDDTELFDKLKTIMSIDINYEIDFLSNKIVYKHSYLLQLVYNTILCKKININVNNSSVCTGSGVGVKKNILFPVESKKIYDIIVMGKLIQSVSKTLSKQKKYDQDYNSNNNNLEVYPLRFRIGNEVLRVVNENLQQDMLKHTKDYIQFIDSFFHGEMTVAGKKFFLCKNTQLPDVNYKLVATLFEQLIHKKIFFTKSSIANCDDADTSMMVSFNNRPTKLYCDKKSLYTIYYTLKRQYAPIEIKIYNNILFVNHHEGLIMLKQKVCINKTITINTLQTPYEYHNKNSLINTLEHLQFCNRNNYNNTQSLMSQMILSYYKDYLHIFNTTPVAKLIVSLTNLKNGMVVQKNDFKILPIGNSVVVDESIYCNDRMFCLWTIVMDSHLKTAEDPYIPHINLPIKIYYKKIIRLKGRIEQNNYNHTNVNGCYMNSGNNDLKWVYKNSSTNNVIPVEGENYLCIFGTLVCNNKINWNYDGKKFKIEYCVSKQWHVYKFYMYFRKVSGQVIDTIHSDVVYEDNTIHVKLKIVYYVTDLEGLKICGVHGQKGVLNESKDLSNILADDGSNVHAQICLSPVSYLSRQTNFNNLPVKYHTCVNGKRYPMFHIPYMFFNNTPDNIYKEFIGKNVTGYEKLEGTRLDQWSINQSFVGNRLSEGLQCIRNGNHTTHPSGQYTVFQSLLHCNNITIIDK
nr:lef-8 [Cnaphalocrocis medinalis granulovirus]